MSTAKAQADELALASSNTASVAICAGAVAICASALSMMVVASVMKAFAKSARQSNQGNP